MKKIITTILAALFVFAMNAQITLTQADFGNKFFHCVQAHDTLVDSANVHIGSPSANSQTWNFTALHNNSTDTITFMDAATTSYASSFSNANIAFTQSNSPGTYNFLNSTTSGVNAIGQGIDHGNITLTTPNEAVILNTPQTYMPFPSTLNSTFSGNCHTTIVIDTSFTYLAFNIDTVHDLHFITYSSVIDAWGTVTTPLGTFPCVRQKYTEKTIDSIYVHAALLGWIYGTITIVDSTLSYRWYANNQGYPIVEINMNKTQTWDSSANWILNSSAGLPGIDFAGTSVSIYPNPASTEINVVKGFDKTITVVIYDLLGNKITEQILTDNFSKISTATYPSGLYTYRIFDGNKTAISNGKLSIIK